MRFLVCFRSGFRGALEELPLLVLLQQVVHADRTSTTARLWDVHVRCAYFEEFLTEGLLYVVEVHIDVLPPSAATRKAHLVRHVQWVVRHRNVIVVVLEEVIGHFPLQK